MAMDITDIKVPLKTVIAVSLWIASMVGLYYTMDFRVTTQEEKTNRLESILNKNNPELLELKITNLESEVAKLNTKADKIYDLLDKN